MLNPAPRARAREQWSGALTITTNRTSTPITNHFRHEAVAHHSAIAAIGISMKISKKTDSHRPISHAAHAATRTKQGKEQQGWEPAVSNPNLIHVLELKWLLL